MTAKELEAIYDELEVQEERARRRYEALFWAHPHCADEKHPGCSQCCEEEEYLKCHG